MSNRYKITLSGSRIYREIELAPDASQVKVGTSVDCDARLRKELFFGQVELLFFRHDNKWSVACSDNLYLTVGDVRKLATRELTHGDTLAVRYQDSDSELFRLSFMLDFDYEERNYDAVIDIEDRHQVVIGGVKGADIYLSDGFVGGDSLTLKKKGNGWTIVDNATRYGICLNGARITRQADLKDRNFFSIAGFSFYYKEGKLYTAATSRLRTGSLPIKRVDHFTTHFTYPDYLRNNRVQHCLPEQEIEIQRPRPKPQKPTKNLLFSLIPSLAMLAMMILLRGIMGNGGTFVIYSVVSMSIGIIMSVVTYRYENKKYAEEVTSREQEYQTYIRQKEAEIKTARDNELRIRNLIYESLGNSIDEVMHFGKRVFERSPEDKDFLDIYLGTGDVEAAVPVKFTKEEFVDLEDPIVLMPEQVERENRYLHNAPIVSRFHQSCGVGIVGPRPALEGVMKNISLDLAIRHFYKEVKMYYMFGDSREKAIRWVKWLRHAYNDEIGIRNIMCDEESRKILLDNLYGILSAREAAKKEQESVSFDTAYVVFAYNAAAMRTHPVSKYIRNCNRYGFTFVFFEENEEYLPMGCTEVIRLNRDGKTGSILPSENADLSAQFAYSSVSDELARQVSLRLGAISVDEVSLESELTKNITMFELLKILTVEDLNLKERWGSSQVFKSMAVPIGVKTKDEIVYLDLSDKSSAHGPHGLVAGTTGSGKSELLQTYVLAVATLFHPYDIGFVIIDFKGGGMANQFKNLPHMMGAITNIDGREIDRSLLSIKAELVKRQALFAQAGVNHINDYIKLYKKGSVTEPMPHLVIIVDEFAELKAEYPDFMKELISAARIGRTLGVHLILATQKPAGVVDAQIWSNSKFKLCLKVQTKEDSNEVIKTPLAAEIKEPGRAYFQVGNNEMFELFQSAYSGTKVTAEGTDKNRTFSIYAVNSWGKREIVYTNKKKGSSEDARNQLQVIVDYVEDYCKETGIKLLSGICLPPLPEVVRGKDLEQFENNAARGIVVPVGIYDDPERQDQGNYCINLSDNNTYVIGAAMTGKTTLLQTILLKLMECYTPRDVNVYIIDCGNMTLKVFEGSNIVGGVTFAAEEERVSNLFKMIFRIIRERKQILSDKGLGTHKAYKEAGYTDMPQIILMIDNLASFREYYDNLSDDFLALSREGTSVGISVVATATQTNAMNYRALSNYGTRISYVCNDSAEYMNLFDRCRIQPKETAGRGLCVIDKRMLEFQTALCVEGDKEFIRMENIKKAIQSCNAKYRTLKAAPIPFVPEVLKKSVLKLEQPQVYQKPYSIPVGMDFASVQFVYLDLLNVGSFAITGKPKSGKTNFMKNILDAIQGDIFQNMTKAWVFDDSNMALDFCKDYGYVDKYELDETEVEGTVGEMLEEMQRRSAILRNNRGVEPQELLVDEPLLLLVLQNRAVVEYINKKADLLNKVKTLLSGMLGLKMCVVFSNVENATVGFNTPEIYKVIKNNKKLFVFEDASEFKFPDITVKQQKDNAKPLKLGDAYMCFNNGIKRIRTIYLG